MKYIFPFKDVDKDTKIILYGSGDVGYQFYRQVISTEYCDVVAWVDRQYLWYQSLKLPVTNPEVILEKSYDYIVLACADESVANSIKSYLLSIGVEVEKIIWKQDYSIGYDIVAKYDSEKNKIDSESAICISPVNLLEERRMDVIIRYMYAKDLIENNDTTHSKRVYEKLIHAQTNACEETNIFMIGLFSAYEKKQGIDAFHAGMKELIPSMLKNGFEREYFIPLDQKMRMLNGAHRCAVALALGIDVWVKEYPCDGFNWDFSKEWLEENGFTKDEVNEVTNTYKMLSLKKGV